jgi:vitamin B12 transporter
MMKPLHVATCLTIAGGCPMPALAADAADTARTIVVTANRAPTPIAAVGQSVTVIDTAELQTFQRVTVVDALRLVPGVTIARNGGIGTSTSVNIRGADSDQTVALIDGVKINDPSSPGGGFNFGPLLVGNIRRIEVVRGSQSVLWGSQAIGGVINMITAEPTDALAANARAEGGWRNSGQIVGNVSRRFGPVAASIGAGWFRTDGLSAFNEDRGGIERDGFENFAANGRLVIDLADSLSVDLRGFWSDGRTDIDGFPPPRFQFADTLETTRSKQFVGYSGIDLALFDGRLRNRLGFAYTSIARRNQDPDATPRETFDALGRNERFEYQGIADIASFLGATFGLERETSRFRTQSFGGPISRASARLDSIYGQLELKPLPGLFVNAGIRHDDHDVYGGSTVFAANGSFTPNDGATIVRASYGEGFKAPSLFQLFSDFGNRALEPERSRSVDAGIAQRLADGALELSATLFRRDVTNQIIFISCFGNPSPICVDRPFGTYDNVARARGQGVEVTLLMRPTDSLELRAGYGHVEAVNRDTAKLLPRRPQDSANAAIDWTAPFGLSLGTTVSVTGASFDNARNTIRLKGYTLVDLRAALAIGRGVELFGRVENLFDERYETIFRYGTPGRAAYGGVRWSL